MELIFAKELSLTEQDERLVKEIFFRNIIEILFSFFLSFKGSIVTNSLKIRKRGKNFRLPFHFIAATLYVQATAKSVRYLSIKDFTRIFQNIFRS
jgi:hypothetical protein